MITKRGRLWEVSAWDKYLKVVLIKGLTSWIIEETSLEWTAPRVKRVYVLLFNFDTFSSPKKKTLINVTSWTTFWLLPKTLHLVQYVCSLSDIDSRWTMKNLSMSYVPFFFFCLSESRLTVNLSYRFPQPSETKMGILTIGLKVTTWELETLI